MTKTEDEAPELFRRVVGKIRMRHRPHQRLLLERDKADPQGRWYIQVECERPDIVTGEAGTGRGGKMYLTEHVAENELVQAAFGLFKAYDEHEVREAFEYDGVALFNPHIDVRAQMEAARHLTYRGDAS